MDALLRRRAMIAAGGGSPTPPAPVLPEGYTALEYIENPLGNTAYFSTGVGQNGPTDYKIDFMSYDENDTSSYGCILGGRYNSNVDDYQLTTYTGNVGWSGGLRFGGASQNFDAHLPVKNTRFSAELSGNTYKIGGSQYTISRGSLNDNYILYMFALNNVFNRNVQQNGHGRLYSLKLYVNGTLSRDYVPCISPNNVVGVYDFVNNTFTGSRNSTPFVAGPTI